jgi:hypothetical protein
VELAFIAEKSADLFDTLVVVIIDPNIIKFELFDFSIYGLSSLFFPLEKKLLGNKWIF